MTWVRLDADFYTHPKVLSAGTRAELLFIHGLCYCNQHLTDGLIPRLALPSLLPRGYREAAEKLVANNLWETAPDGYRIHDFHKYQPSRQQVMATRVNKVEAGRAGADKRWHVSASTEPIAEPIAPCHVSANSPGPGPHSSQKKSSQGNKPGTGPEPLAEAIEFPSPSTRQGICLGLIGDSLSACGFDAREANSRGFLTRNRTEATCPLCLDALEPVAPKSRKRSV